MEKNGDLISRKELLARFREEFGCNVDCSECPLPNTECYEGRVILNAPAVDAEPVKHGQWVIKYIRGGDHKYCIGIICSECATVGTPRWKRCPVCEAKMDGGET